ncbi:hypothetical protein [Rheinheimera gaetbuli]
MQTTPIKPLQQLQQHVVAADKQNTHRCTALCHGQCHQALQQKAYLSNVYFLAGTVAGSGFWQTQPDSQLFLYRQFISVRIGVHIVLASVEQISDVASLTPFGVPNNVYFWSDVKVGCFQ